MSRYRNLSVTLSLVMLLARFCLRHVLRQSDNTSTTATTTVTPPPTQTLTVVPRPQSILNLMKARGEQDQAAPR